MNALNALIFGFTLAIAIGPIALLIIHNGINHGLAVGVRSGVGAAAADLVYSLFAFAVGSGVIAELVSRPQLMRLSRIAGAALLIVIGAWLAWKALHPRTKTPVDAASRSRVRAPGFWATFALTLANPLTLVIFIGFAAQLSPGGDSLAALYYSVCVFLGSLVVQMGLALLGASIGKWLANPRVIAVLNFVSGAAIVAFGLRGLMAAS